MFSISRGECLFQLQFVNSKISVVYFECKKIQIYIFKYIDYKEKSFLSCVSFLCLKFGYAEKS